MRTIVHLSDIHFGRVDGAIIEPLIRIVDELKPDVVAVSGDLTQRARSRQFIEARAFLDKLPKPQIVVPGNHDIPLHNVLTRFLQPLDKYRQYITDDLQPFYADVEFDARRKRPLLRNLYLRRLHVGRSRHSILRVRQGPRA